jgi:hypothetical protein
LATSGPISLGQTGLTLSGLSLLLYDKATPSSNPVLVGGAVLAAITLTELRDTLYYFGNLPDPGEAERYSLSLALASSPASIITTYEWGFGTQAVVPSVAGNLAAGVSWRTFPISLARPSQQPVPQVEILGLPADPTGCAATFALQPLGGGGAVALTGTCVYRISTYAPGLWRLVVEFHWSAGDVLVTGGPLAPGSYYGAFTTSALPGDVGVVTAPAKSSLTVNVS